jgi:hypothetical protein
MFSIHNTNFMDAQFSEVWDVRIIFPYDAKTHDPLSQLMTS